MVAAEKQFFYSINPPNLVYSFDHDAFFPSGPDWSIESLGAAGYPQEDDVIVTQCGLRGSELAEASRYLDRITPEIIASTIGAVPIAWGGLSDDERVALAQYLWERCETMRS
jgi:hypothetical protein